MNATVNIRIEYTQIFQYVFMDFLKNGLTWPFFELKKCSFFLNGSEFCQKLIGTIYQGASPAPTCIVPHKQNFRPKKQTSMCRVTYENANRTIPTKNVEL